MGSPRFEEYCRRKEQAAAAAEIPGYRTVRARAAKGLISVGNAWSATLFDGPFYRSGPATDAGLPAVSLVFVQSRNGNTGATDPSVLGGGATDLHLIYEGLSRVDADAVLGGAASAQKGDVVYSVWHPGMVALRKAHRRGRHPAQIVVTSGGDLHVERGLMFQEPELRVFLVTTSGAAGALRERARERPWIEVIDAGEPLSFRAALADLRTRGIEVVSAIGGRRTATCLLREHLVADLYLTTSPREGGEPGTPFYEGPPLPLRTVVEKAGQGPEAGVRFEHFLVGGSSTRGPGQPQTS